MPKLPKLKLFERKPKNKDFLIVEIGLEKITAAIFQKKDSQIKLSGVGKKRFSLQEEVFDTVLESLDALATIVPDFPTGGILGISGGSMETITTIARYNRQNPKRTISTDETSETLHQIVADLDTGEKKIFFSTVAGADIDGVRVTNPIGLKGERIELSCFCAFKTADEMEQLDRLMNEIDIKLEKIIPTSFTIGKYLEQKNVRDVLLFRVGLHKAELTVMMDGHVAEILPIGLGAAEPALLPIAWEVAIAKFEKGKLPDLVWLFSDNDQVDLEKIKNLLNDYDWRTKLGFSLAPRVEIATAPHGFADSDTGIFTLSQQELHP